MYETPHPLLLETPTDNTLYSYWRYVRHVIWYMQRSEGPAATQVQRPTERRGKYGRTNRPTTIIEYTNHQSSSSSFTESGDLLPLVRCNGSILISQYPMQRPTGAALSFSINSACMAVSESDMRHLRGPIIPLEPTSLGSPGTVLSGRRRSPSDPGR